MVSLLSTTASAVVHTRKTQGITELSAQSGWLACSPQGEAADGEHPPPSDPQQAKLIDDMPPLADGPASDLDQLYLTLRPEPLIEPDEFKMFYRGEVNQVRGEDTVARLARKLRQSHRSVSFKAFLMGHPGVGKSTEISRLLEETRDHYTGIRLSIATELNPASFKVFDVLLLILIRLTEEANRQAVFPVEATLSTLASSVQQWFSETHITQTGTRNIGAGVEAGGGIKEGSPWATLLGLFATAKAEMKYTAERKTESVEYNLRRLPDLLSLCNRLITACNDALLQHSSKEYLVIVEDFDKTGISPQQLQELFIQYGTVFQDLRVNIIFTIPVWLAYSDEANRLPFDRYMIHDTPVYDSSHSPHEKGRSAVQKVLEARAAPSLFADGQMTRLIVASGGNLRDLFALVLDAGESALLRDAGSKRIESTDADLAINKMRRDYRMKLGQSPYDSQPIPYSKKSERLLAVYHGNPDHDIPDPVLYSLLRCRAIQEFNGRGWYGVHPLVVEILKEQEHLKPQEPGGTD